MARYTVPLDSVQVASPCDILWEEMKGTDRVRHCNHCERSVYNLSAMSRREAEEFVQQREGRLCIRFYRRADGTMLTDDCPVGQRAARRKVAFLVGAAAASVLAVGAWGIAFAGFLFFGSDRPWWSNPIPVPPSLGPPPGGVVMGEMCPPQMPPDVPQIELPEQEARPALPPQPPEKPAH